MKLWASLLTVLLMASWGWAIQPSEAVAFAYRDIRTVSPDLRPYTRYLWVSQDDPKLKWSTWAAVAGHVNHLSTRSRIVSPVMVLDDGSMRVWPNVAEGDYGRIVLIRLCILDYGWEFEQWEKLGDPNLEPVFHVFTEVPYPAGKMTDGTPYRAGREKVVAFAPWLLYPLGLPEAGPLREAYLLYYQQAAVGLAIEAGYSETPIVEARNFIWQTAVDFDRKAGYFSWLRIKSKKDFDKLARVDFSIVPLREAVRKSGVANQPRRIDRFGRGDPYWITYDQVNQRGQRLRDPVETVDDTFEFDANEIYARLLNGLWFFGLFDSKGNIQQSAPDGVGYNHQSVTNDGKIHVCLSCIQCHDSGAGRGGLQTFTPYFRTTYSAPGNVAFASVKDPKKFAKLVEQYLTPYEPWADVDRLIYIRSLAQANGLTPDKYATVLYDTYKSWERPLTLEMVAPEFGVTAATLQTAVQQQLLSYGYVSNNAASWANPPQTRIDIGRDQFAVVYNEGQLILRNLPAGGWPDYVRRKYPTRPAQPAGVKK